MRWFGISLLAFTFTAAAQELDLVGSTGWNTWNARRIEIIAEEIANNRDRGSSGPLDLVIYATPNQPSGGDFSGSYAIGVLHLRSLAAGSSFEDLDYLVRYNAPPAGFYYTGIALEEYTDAGWVLSDWEDFPGVVNFGGYGFGEATVEAAGEIFFEGNVSWSSASGGVIISADHIANEGPRRSGLLRMRLWALRAPYTGAVLDGYPLATKSLGKLKSGFEFQNYSRRAPFRAPPEGEYYVTLVLEERVPGGWFVRDWVNFPGTSIF